MVNTELPHTPIVDAQQRFRRTPDSFSISNDPVMIKDNPENRCYRQTGHVLRIKEGTIICTLCPAEWKDEGF